MVAIRECPVSSPKINDLIATLNRLARDPRWPRFSMQLEAFTDERRVQWNIMESERPVAKRFFRMAWRRRSRKRCFGSAGLSGDAGPVPLRWAEEAFFR